MADGRLKILIVDDEYLVRNLFINCLDWEGIGFEITGEASCAEEALELVERLAPDIIFTDICMPNMDGIDFSRLVSEKYPHIRVVILTGYDEFEYAKRSIKAGIADFLLKPINDEEIAKTVLDLKAAIAAERQRSDEYSRLKALLEENLPYLKERFPSEIPNTNAGIFEEFDREKTRKISKTILEMKDYILRNMSDPGLSLSDVAARFFLNPSYLSRIFKQETGQNFIDFLTEVRMEQAVRLLRETDLKGYEIAERIGIQDPHYFSVYFKKFTGMSVIEYKNKNLPR